MSQHTHTRTRTHMHTHTSLFPAMSPGGKVVWSTASLLMTPLAIQVCVGWPVCLSQRRQFLSELCQPEEHRWSPWFPHPLPFRVLPHLQDTPRASDVGAGRNQRCLHHPSGHWKGWCSDVGGDKGSSRWAGAAPLSTNGIIVWPPQVLTIQMRSQLKCGSSEVEQVWNFSAQNWRIWKFTHTHREIVGIWHWVNLGV